MTNDYPEGWGCIKLSDLLKPNGIFDGPFGSSLKTSDYTTSGVRVIRLENLANLKFIEDRRTYISQKKYEDLRKHTVVSGDLIVGSFVDHQVRVCLIPDLPTTAIAKADCFCVRPRPDLIDTRYLMYFIGQSQTRDGFLEHIHGATRPRITTKQLRELLVALPPLAEQRRIVVKVEELLARVNAARERLARVPAILKRFRQSILAAACSGQLTADWRQQAGIGIDAKSVRLDEIAEYLGGYAYKSPTFLTSGANQVIRIGNVKPMNLDKAASPVFIPETIAEETQRFELKPGDIVISMTGTKYKRDYGFPAMVPRHAGRWFLNQRVSRVRCGKTIVPNYLLYWMQSKQFRDHFFDGETGNVNQGNVGADGIRKAPVVAPSIEEQLEIVRRVEALFALADKIDARVQAATTRVEKITQAILAKAFRGELVPTEAELARRQSRPYEPASALLARIRAQNAATNGTPRTATTDGSAAPKPRRKPKTPTTSTTPKNTRPAAQKRTAGRK